jgi:insulysin
MSQSPVIEKSINDNREYEYLKLDNGIQCIIILDTTESMCGACLNVNIGSVNEKIEGLAHFLEHMVFMGSKKYPDSNDFMSSINNNGGKTNAYTSDTDTNYHFTVDPSSFTEILDKFAQFFTDPLLKKEYIEREINAVDSEAKKNFLNDGWIQLELCKTLFNKEHPINHFSCGDVDSLKIPNIYQELKSFHENNYDAKYMNLIVFTNNDNKNNNNIEHIKHIVKETFGKINTNPNIEINRKYGKILKNNSITYYVPNRDEHFLNILIEMKTVNNILESPYPFIIQILSSEITDSLYEYLLNKGFVTSCEINESISYEDNTLLSLEYILTDEGLENYKEVYTIIINYFNFLLDKLKNNDEDLKKLYEELIQSNINNFNFWEKEDIIESIIPLTNIMKENVPREYIVSYDIHYATFETISASAKLYFDEQFYAISLGTKKNKSICKENFPRYNVCYKTDIFDIVIEPVKYNFTIPVLNKYICYNLKFDETIVQSSHPLNLTNDANITKYNSFYYGDKTFKSPIVDIRTIIKLPNILKDVETYVAMLLYLNAAYSDINELKDMAVYAGYTFYIKLDYDLLYILLSGYNEKIDLVVDLIKDIFQKDFKTRSFKTAKFELTKNLKNYNKSSPITKLNVMFQKCIYSNYFTPDEQYKVIKNMTIQKCRDIFKKNFNNYRVNILTIGNISQDKTIEINDTVYNNLQQFEQTQDNKQIDLDLTDNIIRLKEPMVKIVKVDNDDEDNSLGAVIYDLFRFRKCNKYTNGWKSLILFARIYNMMVSNKFFYELRTKKQMGYIVKVNMKILDNNYYSNIFIEFLIQSPKFSVKDIFKETEDFIKQENDYILNKMTEKEYIKSINAEESKLKKSFLNIGDLGSYYMGSILDESFNFIVKEELLEKIKLFDFNKFKKYLKMLIINNNSIYKIGLQKTK